MSNVLQIRSPEQLGLMRLASAPSPQPPLVESSGRRARIWEVSPSLHCSIIGTCLSAAELRQLLVKFDEAGARTASDHTLHKCGVLAAGRRDKLGKALQKLLDGKHETTIRQFVKAESAEEVRAFWMRSFEQGLIPGGYWAVITHPSTTRTLVEEAFGQIHMLSHMIGSSNRADIQRLRELEREIAERDEKIVRQQARLADSALERSALRREVEKLSADLRSAASSPSESRPAFVHDADTALRRLDAEKRRSARLIEQIGRLEKQLSEAQREGSGMEAQRLALESELASLERILTPSDDCRPERARRIDGLAGRTILYVGGRPGLVASLRGLCIESDTRFLAHDGGIEDSLSNLPGYVSRADLVVFPVDCVSHSAVGIIRKICNDSAKPYVPLRKASIASFVDALGRTTAPSQHSARCC